MCNKSDKHLRYSLGWEHAIPIVQQTAQRQPSCSCPAEIDAKIKLQQLVSYNFDEEQTARI